MNQVLEGKEKNSMKILIQRRKHNKFLTEKINLFQ